MGRLDRSTARSTALLGTLLVLALWLGPTPGHGTEPAWQKWRQEFPHTDFTRRSIDLAEIVTDGPTRDSIPPIDEPRFVDVAKPGQIGAFEPVVSVVLNCDARAYPLRILLWHEIVNDVVGGVPILVSYCPLCNSAVVFDRRANGRVLEFGNTGRIRHYDMVMYDRATESWWQQFLGEAIIGEMTGPPPCHHTGAHRGADSLPRACARGQTARPHKGESPPLRSDPLRQVRQSRAPTRLPLQTAAGARPDGAGHRHRRRGVDPRSGAPQAHRRGRRHRAAVGARTELDP